MSKGCTAVQYKALGSETLTKIISGQITLQSENLGLNYKPDHSGLVQDSIVPYLPSRYRQDPNPEPHSVKKCEVCTQNSAPDSLWAARH